MTDVSDTHEGEKKSTVKRTLSRKQTAQVLGRSESHVRRCYDKVLKPVQVLNGAGHKRWRYDPVAVAALRDELKKKEAERTAVAKVRAPSGWSTAEGEVAAELFRRFRAEETLVDIVVAMEIPPEIVRHHREEYLRTFEDDERERKSAATARRDRLEGREHAKHAARLDREQKEQAERRAARRAEILGGSGAAAPRVDGGLDGEKKV